MRRRNTKEDIEAFIPVRSCTKSVSPDRTRNSRCVVFYSLDRVTQNWIANQWTVQSGFWKSDVQFSVVRSRRLVFPSRRPPFRFRTSTVGTVKGSLLCWEMMFAIFLKQAIYLPLLTCYLKFPFRRLELCVSFHKCYGP